jgi:recombination protein RecR
MADSHSLEGLIQALRSLPGVGVKSASRMAFHLLQHDREGARVLSLALAQAARRCNTASAATPSPRRPCAAPAWTSAATTRLCVVETPADQSAVERTGAYKGLYFVLMGKLSPLDGIGPKDIGLKNLFDRACDGVVQRGHPGHQLHGRRRGYGACDQRVPARTRGLQITRLARGVPVGSELEYVDLGTIAHALVDRR